MPEPGATLADMGAPEVSAVLRKRVEQVLADFGPWRDDEATDMTRIAIDPTRLPVPGLVHFTLVKVLGLPDWGRGEKTAFEIPFTYLGVKCTIAHQKFGVRLYVGAGDEEAVRTMGDEIVGKLLKAIRVVEKGLLRDYGEARVAGGEITIVNQLHSLRGMYRHFRDSAEATFATRKKNDGKQPPAEFAGLARLLNRALTLNRSGAYSSLAAINAYFSYLEHALVLVLPFTDFDPAAESITGFIGLRWRDKFKRVFNINADATAKRLHDRLHEVSETYRNTYGHGGFDKEGGSIYFHVPEVGALPARLTDVRDSPHFDVIPVGSLDFEELCALFDEVDDFLATSQVTRFGMRYAEAGMNVLYDERSRRRFAEAMESDEQFEELLDHDSYVETLAMNMDW